jgi:hypothetical protein
VSLATREERLLRSAGARHGCVPVASVGSLVSRRRRPRWGAASWQPPLQTHPERPVFTGVGGREGVCHSSPKLADPQGRSRTDGETPPVLMLPSPPPNETQLFTTTRHRSCRRSPAATGRDGRAVIQVPEKATDPPSAEDGSLPLLFVVSCTRLPCRQILPRTTA